ncbi:MAG: hypothetical protein KJZ86_14510 [Caldilineaceae bacterium]|nr:hypothetical protein [Caldilineaceae bacterium]HRJ45267.1 hypothetical protein [Caldilineaceae bacterium]
MRLLILGGTVFLGRHLADAALSPVWPGSAGRTFYGRTKSSPGVSSPSGSATARSMRTSPATMAAGPGPLG